MNCKTGAMRALGWSFYEFIGNGGVRLMCSWDTGEGDVLSFVKDLKEIIARTSRGNPHAVQGARLPEEDR